MSEYLSTKVTFINDRYHIRLIDTRNGKIWDEMTCKTRMAIGPTIREMMRFHDKLGGTSKMADKSRHRNK